MFRRLYFLWRENNRDQSNRSSHLSRRNRIKSAMMDKPSSGLLFQINTIFDLVQCYVSNFILLHPHQHYKVFDCLCFSKTCVHVNLIFQQTRANAVLLFFYIRLFSFLISCK